MLHSRSDYQSRIQDSENKIPADEPVFLIRGQDLFGARLVREWVRLSRKQLKDDIAKGLGKDTPEAKGRKKAIALAEAHAFRMDDWPKKKAGDV